jgi:predicted DCC family thiol-disulfide oxidoreductase YuxK
MSSAPQPELGQREIIFYDGNCGLCHALVRFTVLRDRAARFAFAPLGGETFRATPFASLADLPDSVVVQTAAGKRLIRSAAVLHVLRSLGGGWRAPAALLGVLPRPLLDWGYRVVARLRRKLFAPPVAQCPRVPNSLRSRFLP